MTVAEFLTIPEDGKRRWLIRGELREEEIRFRETPNAIALTNIVGPLTIWTNATERRFGTVACGEVSIQFSNLPETFIGIDAVFVSKETMAKQTDDNPYFYGVPSLVVEILSRKTRFEYLQEKIATYRSAAVPLVWVIDPHKRTVAIYQNGKEPMMADVHSNLTGGDVLPGFSVPVSRLFE